MTPSPSQQHLNVWQRILTHPPTAQVVILAYITRDMMAEGIRPSEHEEHWERFATAAVEFWEGQIAELSARIQTHADEDLLAGIIVEKLRKQERWGKVLRSGTNA